MILMAASISKLVEKQILFQLSAPKTVSELFLGQIQTEMQEDLKPCGQLDQLHSGSIHQDTLCHTKIWMMR